jgi:LacI family transcriptional regulator
MVTIKTIADLAGVSPTTVSNVIHGRTGRVSPDTLAKVQKILQDEHYVSNMGAQILGHHGSKLIALVVAYRPYERESLLEDPFVSSVTAAVEQAVREHGYFMMLYNNPDMKECLRMAREWNIEGMILLGAQREDYFMLRDELKIPVVSIDTCYLPGDKNFVNVGLCDYEGAFEMTEYLIRCGHTRIGFLALMQNTENRDFIYVDSAREKGYLDAMAHHGLKVEKEWMTKLEFYELDRLAQYGRIADNGFMGCTALFFASDTMAIEAMLAFANHGKKAPDDISIAGFDDSRLARRIKPRLTTVRQDFALKGKRSVEELINLIHNSEYSSNVLLPVTLVKGESVKKIR